MIVVCGSGVKTEPNTHKMKGKRRRHDPEFKARVALDALKWTKVESSMRMRLNEQPEKLLGRGLLRWHR